MTRYKGNNFTYEYSLKKGKTTVTILEEVTKLHDFTYFLCLFVIYYCSVVSCETCKSTPSPTKFRS